MIRLNMLKGDELVFVEGITPDWVSVNEYLENYQQY